MFRYLALASIGTAEQQLAFLLGRYPFVSGWAFGDVVEMVDSAVTVPSMTGSALAVPSMSGSAMENA